MFADYVLKIFVFNNVFKKTRYLNLKMTTGNDYPWVNCVSYCK